MVRVVAVVLVDDRVYHYRLLVDCKSRVRGNGNPAFAFESQRFTGHENNIRSEERL